MTNPETGIRMKKPQIWISLKSNSTKAANVILCHGTWNDLSLVYLKHA